MATYLLLKIVFEQMCFYPFFNAATVCIASMSTNREFRRRGAADWKDCSPVIFFAVWLYQQHTTVLSQTCITSVDVDEVA